MSSRNGSSILIGKKQIMDYLNVGDYAFNQFILQRMPAVVINNRWYAHKDNIDAFFKKLTGYSMGEIPDDAE